MRWKSTGNRDYLYHLFGDDPVLWSALRAFAPGTTFNRDRALHKAWLAHKPTRDPLKRPKDARQSAAVWSWLRDGLMARFPLDAAVEAIVPEARHARAYAHRITLSARADYA